MIFDVHNLPKADVYRLLTHTVVPRPIAWVLTENENGSHNLAPYSYFNVVSSDPGLLMFSVGHKRDGSKKDTWYNIEQREKFVIHIADASLANMVNESARPLPLGESEINHIETALVADKAFGMSRLEAAPVAFACKRYDIHLVGNGPQAVIYAQVEAAYVADHLEGESSLLVDALSLNPLARLGAEDYSSLGEIKSIPRPK